MRSIRAFAQAERAVVAATTAVLMPALMLFMALGVEVGEWYAIDRQMQTVADAAAVAAAIQLSNGGTLATATTMAGWSSKVNGFTGAPTVNSPPSFGAYSGNGCASVWCTGYVEAIVSRPEPTIFARLYSSSVTVGGRAVASWSQNYQTCGLALGTGATDISVTGSPTLTLGSGCVLASDSTALDSLDLGGAGGATVSAQSVISAGGFNGACTGCVTGPVTDGPVSPDPFSCTIAANASLCATATTEGFSSVETSIPSGCGAMAIASGVVSNSGSVCYTSMELGASFTGSISGTALTVTAVAAGSIQIGEQITGTGVSSPTYITAYTGSGSAGGAGPYTVSASQTIASEAMGTQLQLSSGTYYDEGSFDVPSGAAVTEVSGATGVTIILANPSVCEGNATFEGTATLTAPNSGTYTGMLLVQVEATGVICALPPSDSIAAGANVTLGGRIYAPGANWAINASPITSCLAGVACGGAASECLTITASTLAFAASTTLEATGCTAPIADVNNVQTISLVE